MRAACANVYLATGRWPRTLALDAEMKKGAILIGREDAGQSLEAVGEVVWRSGPMVAVRVKGSGGR